MNDPTSYEPDPGRTDDLWNRFSYHPPRVDQPERYGTIRERVYLLARLLCEVCPESRELRAAIDRLDEVVMWANAAIARNERGGHAGGTQAC